LTSLDVVARRAARKRRRFLLRRTNSCGLVFFGSVPGQISILVFSFQKIPEAWNQFFRQMVANTGPYSAAVISLPFRNCFNKIGKGILVTHSQSGGPGWRTAIKNDNIRAIVSFEPGGDFIFPEGEAPGSIKLSGRTVTPPAVPLRDFMRLTKIPIIVYYGDNIPGKPSQNPGQEQWRAFLEVAKAWRDVVNRHGGDVTIVHLPRSFSRQHSFPYVRSE